MVASDATAAPQSLTRFPELESFALAGDTALLTHASGRNIRVERMALTPGAPRSTVFRRKAAGFAATAFVAASDALAAVNVISGARRTGRLIAEQFAGPPQGPLTALGPPRKPRFAGFLPVFHDVDGTRLFTAEVSVGAVPLRWVVREPGASPRTLRPPRGTDLSALAGDLVAYASVDGISVENWRTGAEVVRYPATDFLAWLDVRADGAVVTADDDGNVVERVPGAAPIRLARNGAGPAFAGDRVVFLARAGRPGVVQLQVAEPDGRVRPFGVPSAGLTEFVADDQRVLWRGNGCLLTAPITDPAAVAPDAGACPRSEVHVPGANSRRIKRDRRLRIPLHCVAAPPPGCRGTLSLRASFRAPRLAKSLRFHMAVGERARLDMRLTRHGYEAVVRGIRRIGGAPVDIRTVTVDPDGRRSVHRRHFVLYVR